MVYLAAVGPVLGLVLAFLHYKLWISHKVLQGRISALESMPHGIYTMPAPEDLSMNLYSMDVTTAWAAELAALTGQEVSEAEIAEQRKLWAREGNA